MAGLRNVFGKLGAKADSPSARNLIIAQHRHSTLELERIRSFSCQLQSILIALNERYAAAKQQQCPCSQAACLDDAIKRAVFSYRQLGFASGHYLLRTTPMKHADLQGSLTANNPDAYSLRAIVVANDEVVDLDENQNEQLQGLMTEVRERCCRQAKVVGDVMHSAVLYQVMSVKELKKECVTLNRLINKFTLQAEQDNARIVKLTEEYRHARRAPAALRYYKLKSIIKEAIDDYRNR